MVTFVCIMIVLVALTGLCVKFFVQGWMRTHPSPYTNLSIDWKEYTVAVVAMGIVFTPAIFFIGNKFSVNEQLQYKEFYNGVETGALQSSTTCHAGTSGNDESAGQSNCTYTYVCGSYTYEEAYTDTEYYTDSKGNTHTRSVTRYRTRSANIECPYLTKEYMYRITDSLPDGITTLPGVYGDKQPRAWNPDVGIPSNIPLGPPPEWVTSFTRLQQHDPRPVTRMYSYKNFILAAKEDLLLPYVKDIQQYRKKGLLPDHTKNINDNPLYGYNNSLASKVSFVGVTPPGGDAKWQEALNGLNGAIGMTLQGDVHMVIVNSKLISSKVKYIQALKAYWSSEAFGRKAIAKNAIIIAVGVEGDTVKWGEALTGMPYGNEVMLEALSERFNGNIPFTPEAIIGNPRLTFTGKDGQQEPKVTLAEKPGVIERVVLKDFPFARASMECGDKEDGKSCVGFGDLVSKLEPTTGTKLTMGFIIILVSFVLWYLAATFDWFYSLKELWEERKAKD